MKEYSVAVLALLASTVMTHGRVVEAQDVKTDYAKNFDFGTLKRFAWRENHLVTMRRPEDNKLLDQKIMRTVNQELAAKGFIEDNVNPDFFLSYHAGIGDEISQVGVSPTAGNVFTSAGVNSTSTTGWGAGATSSAGFAPSVWYSLQGQIDFFAIDAKSAAVVWQRNVTKKWNDLTKARKNENKEIKQIVERSFEDFPPKRSK